MNPNDDPTVTIQIRTLRPWIRASLLLGAMMGVALAGKASTFEALALIVAAFTLCWLASWRAE